MRISRSKESVWHIQRLSKNQWKRRPRRPFMSPSWSVEACVIRQSRWDQSYANKMVDKGKSCCKAKQWVVCQSGDIQTWTISEKGSGKSSHKNLFLITETGLTANEDIFILTYTNLLPLYTTLRILERPVKIKQQLNWYRFSKMDFLFCDEISVTSVWGLLSFS